MQYERTTPWIQTFSGKRFYPLEPHSDDIAIIDIAHALSQICRFAGHSERFISVAEHSYHVSYYVPPKYALCGLMHDASEAYLTDIPRPIKPLLPEYGRMEKELEKIIAEKYHFEYPLPPEVKDVDNGILRNEYDAVMKKTFEWEFIGQKLDTLYLKFWSPEEAKIKFIERFVELI